MQTANELRTEAQELDRRAEDSFDRCDTDGFVSQWANGMMAQLKRAQAEIVEAGGQAPFEILVDETGRKIDANLIPGKYGAVWLLSDAEAERFGRRFIPFAGSGKSRVQKELGVREDTEMAPAWAKLAGRGTGLSGQAWVEIYRVK